MDGYAKSTFSAALRDGAQVPHDLYARGAGPPIIVRREFHLFTARASSPIVDWLRALCRTLRESARVPGVGVIGMCLTVTSRSR
jgi:hypothetical protein